MNANHVRNLAATTLALGSRTTYLPVLTQAADHFLAQDSHRHLIKGGVDGLMRRSESPIRKVETFDEFGYRLLEPFSPRTSDHRIEKHRLRLQLRWLPSLTAQSMRANPCLSYVIKLAVTGVASQYEADRAKAEI